ncbi:MAG: AAA family ATPase, partial [Eggerthellaceae bacterium]|nr:AAA family ATPase [Eggerthellaceae bacterium]
MIDEMLIENLGLIRQASIVPSPGLTVITGETGAGKTVMLSACKLLMGARADKDYIRQGSDEALVEGRFFLSAKNRDIAENDDLTIEDALESDDDAPINEESELVAIRRISAKGRSRVTINGSLASVSELSANIAPTIELCGQHEHQQLLNPANHVAILDAWGDDNLKTSLAEYRTVYEDMRKAK